MSQHHQISSDFLHLRTAVIKKHRNVYENDNFHRVAMMGGTKESPWNFYIQCDYFFQWSFIILEDKHVCKLEFCFNWDLISSYFGPIQLLRLALLQGKHMISILEFHLLELSSTLEIPAWFLLFFYAWGAFASQLYLPDWQWYNNADLGKQYCLTTNL